MSKEVLEIAEPGLLTTIQDLGRYGYQKYGVPVAGAMDAFALRTANALLGNEDNAAGLEITVLGPRIRFLADTWFALTGGDLSPMLDSQAIPMWQPVEARSGNVLSFRGVSDGMRCYLSVAGGIDVPLVMGSRSTYVKAKLGGLEGRALKSGDVLSALESDGDESGLGQLPPDFEKPTYGHAHEIRVVLGPQNDAFTERGIATFLESEYTVSIQSDRMGYRLDGPKIEHKSGADLVSDGTPLGAVQIPGDGQPIILLADRGITGGYTKIATVISSDISKLAQAMPGDKLTFKLITIEQAHEALCDQEKLLDSIRHPARVEESKKFSIVVDGDAFEIASESGETISPGELTEQDSNSWTRQAKATIGGYTYEFEVKVQRIG